MCSVKIEGWLDPPSFSDVRDWSGEILNVYVDAEVSPNGTPLGEFFRFARIEAVNERTLENQICPRCGERACIAFEIAWESDIDDAQAAQTVVCEYCAFGRVTKGAELIDFGDEGES